MITRESTREEYRDGVRATQVQLWRRSFDTPPPPCELDSEYWPGNDNKYAHIPEADIPLSECLKDTVRRPSLGALAPVGPRP